MTRTNDSWQLGRRAMIGTLIMGGVWGSVLIMSVLIGREANVIGDMFAGICAMNVTTLAVLVGGKGWKEYSQTIASRTATAPAGGIDAEKDTGPVRE